MIVGMVAGSVLAWGMARTLGAQAAVPTVGALDVLLPPLSMPDLSPATLSTLLPSALALSLLALTEAVNVKAMDVRGITDITDMMVVASGTSDRHVKSIADRVVQRCKEAGYRPYGIEGERDGEWVLLDLNDVVLHVMLPRVREFYALEKLWEKGAARRA